MIPLSGPSWDLLTVVFLTSMDATSFQMSHLPLLPQPLGSSPASCLWASFGGPTEQDSGLHMLTLSLLYVPHMASGKHTHLLLTASAIAQ